MSGTSADGIDAILCRVEGSPPALSVTVDAFRALPFPAELQARIHAAAAAGGADAEAICRLNAALGERFADAALAVIRDAGFSPAEVDLIGSHGQTLWHAVDPDGSVAATLQVGEPAVIAERTGITTIAGFRTRDVAAGGQGAPLVSTLDALLFRHPSAWRALQNIGGIGNVTLLPPLADPASRPLAFDTGPGNALIDELVRTISRGGEQLDTDGRRAARGSVDEAWLAELLADRWYATPPPRTTGRERFSPELARHLLLHGRNRGLDDDSIVATVTALTAGSIADAIRRFAPAPPAELVLSGGGARNPWLVARIAALLPGVRVLELAELGVRGEEKEALAFAVMAHETWHGRPWSRPAFTGVRHPVILGSIVPGNNHAALLRRTLREGAG